MHKSTERGGAQVPGCSASILMLGFYSILTTRLELRIAMIAAMKNVLSPISDNKIMPHDLRNACARTNYPF